MSIAFKTEWLGGSTGRETMTAGVTSCYYTALKGVTLNSGEYIGPQITYQSTTSLE